MQQTDTTIPRAIHGRPRGFADWKPQTKTAALIEQIKAILNEYQAHLPLTIRQIFYRLVGAHGYEKTEKGYQRLCDNLSRARRARLISFDVIRDDGFSRTGWMGWSGIDCAKDYITKEASKYRIDRQLGQSEKLIVWCEAQGMVPQLERVCAPFSIEVFSSGGFDSVTVKHSVAGEFAGMGAVKVLHIGDHDPSGVHVFGSLDEDVRAFLDVFGGKAVFSRLAVTPEQISEHNLPTAPPKDTDKRNFTGETVQAEALPPDVLASILDAAIMRHVDMDIYRQAVDKEERDRNDLVTWLGKSAL